MALADFEMLDFSDCRFGTKIWCYRYDSYATTGRIYLNNDGEVQFESEENNTAWHGHWQLHPMQNKMEITFSHEGDVTNMQTLVVFTSSGGDEKDRIWSGRDIHRRFILMTFIDMCSDL